MNRDLIKKGLRHLSCHQSLSFPKSLNRDLIKKGLRPAMKAALARALGLNRDLIKKGLRPPRSIAIASNSCV
ncbi:protein of unknown function [Methylocaldum szegediense]|uniref:Uncharacterized protein n=1 Tax=Methylocaldum szegediense TaxID=73780 RepID=A0ABN8X3V8_9GAMM|nr:protein of unknown function [Methylocaldum szegediense]